ncbi:MAG: type II toxin-antitoxin system HicA family toxin [Candidatus Aminicenantes bacterium]|nr:type II toxin-antitoxin system HicA family toxin [Candidatus Aminicenantes bacterium]
MNSHTGKEFAKLLERRGWKLTRIQGSLHIFVKEGRGERVSVPVHRNRDLKAGNLRDL